MFSLVVSDKLRRVAHDSSEKGDLPKARKALSKARFWAGEARPFRLFVDARGVVHRHAVQEELH